LGGGVVAATDDAPSDRGGSDVRFAGRGSRSKTHDHERDVGRFADPSSGARDPDLVITDVDMPEMFGQGVATVLRRVRGVSVPILLWSSFGRAELEGAIRAAPVDGYIPKSEGLPALLEGVRASLDPGH
jgi:CheY-like chemotaxis protein